MNNDEPIFQKKVSSKSNNNLTEEYNTIQEELFEESYSLFKMSKDIKELKNSSYQKNSQGEQSTNSSSSISTNHQNQKEQKNVSDNIFINNNKSEDKCINRNQFNNHKEIHIISDYSKSSLNTIENNNQIGDNVLKRKMNQTSIPIKNSNKQNVTIHKSFNNKMCSERNKTIKGDNILPKIKGPPKIINKNQRGSIYKKELNELSKNDSLYKKNNSNKKNYNTSFLRGQSIKQYQTKKYNNHYEEESQNKKKILDGINKKFNGNYKKRRAHSANFKILKKKSDEIKDISNQYSKLKININDSNRYISIPKKIQNKSINKKVASTSNNKIILNTLNMDYSKLGNDLNNLMTLATEKYYNDIDIQNMFGTLVNNINEMKVAIMKKSHRNDNMSSNNNTFNDCQNNKFLNNHNTNVFNDHEYNIKSKASTKKIKMKKILSLKNMNNH